MGLDFSRLVLAPAMGVFGTPITFAPLVSQPGAPAYPARGVYAVKQVTTRTEEGAFTDQQPTLGIRLSEFAVPPKQGDQFVMNGKTWEVWDPQPDEQGGMDLVIKQI